jgi:transposase
MREAEQVMRECSSGGRQKLDSISKQGNSFVRTLLVESALATVVRRRHKPKAAKVAARKWRSGSTGCTAHHTLHIAQRVAPS